MPEQEKLFNEAPLNELPTPREILGEMAGIAMSMCKEADRIAAAKLYLEKYKDVIDDGVRDDGCHIKFSVHKAENATD